VHLLVLVLRVQPPVEAWYPLVIRIAFGRYYHVPGRVLPSGHWDGSLGFGLQQRVGTADARQLPTDGRLVVAALVVHADDRSHDSLDGGSRGSAFPTLPLPLLLDNMRAATATATSSAPPNSKCR